MTKGDVKDIPLWIKLPNLLLCSWNEAGISKVTSCVGLLLVVDNLTASKERITFTIVCVQVSSNSPLPDSIPLNLSGIKFQQEVSYDWKSKACKACHTFSYEDRNCPLNPLKHPIACGRSHNRLLQPVCAPMVAPGFGAMHNPIMDSNPT